MLPRKTAGSLLLLAAIAGLATAPAIAQPVPDHLKCYKVKDSAGKQTYTADLTGLTAEPGCTIKVPAVELCVEAVKANVTPAPPGGGPAPTAAGNFVCYKLKCPKGTLAPVMVNDQFGSRMVTPTAPKVLCAPEGVAGTTTTTTTVATTSSTSSTSSTTSTSTTTTTNTTETTTSTTTTLPPCGSAQAPECNGDCTFTGGVCVFDSFLGFCRCGNPTTTSTTTSTTTTLPVCGNAQAPACNGSCPIGEQCFDTGLGGCSCF